MARYRSSRKLKSSSFSKAKLLVVALLVAVAGGAYVFATQAASNRTYTFDIKKNSSSVLTSNLSGEVDVGVNMPGDKDLKDVRFIVDGTVKAQKDNMTAAGFRVFYRWNTTAEANGAHTVTVRAKSAQTGVEFDVYNAVTDTKATQVTVANGAASGGGGSGGGSSGGSNSSSSSTSSTATEAVTLKPKLSVAAGPDPDIPNSSAGTVNGENIKGGVVFTVKFKRPKSENYDLKTMHVNVTKDGQHRFTIYQNPETEKYASLKVTEEGDFKVYTFKRNYQTINKPNGSSTWVAHFQPIVSVPPSETESNPLVLNIDNPDSTAEATCRELKTDVNKWFTDITRIIDTNQQKITEVNTRIDQKYQELNLATSNPIPDYDAKKAANAQKSQDVDTKQAELEALKLDCDGGNTSVEDAGAQVAAFKSKLEEAKGAMSVYRDGTLNLLGELRTRLPQDGDDDDNEPTIPAGFVEYNSPCYSFAARRGFTTENSSVSASECNKHVKFENRLSNGFTQTGRIAPNPWPRRTGTLAENVSSTKDSETALGRTIASEQSFQLDGHNAVRFVSKNGEADKILYVLVEAPYKINNQNVGGYQIMVPGYGNRDNNGNGNFVKDAADKALATWQWKETGGGGGGGTQPAAVPNGFKRINTSCYTTNELTSSKLIDVEANNNTTFNCDRVDQIANNAGEKVNLSISNLNTGPSATLDHYVRGHKESFGRYSYYSLLAETPLTVDGQKAVKLEYKYSDSNFGAFRQVFVYMDSPTYINRAASASMKGARLSYSAPINTGQSRLAERNLNEMLTSWRWKPAFDAGSSPTPIPADELSKVACLGNNTDGKRVEIIYVRYEGEDTSLGHPLGPGHGQLATLTKRMFIKRTASRMNRNVIQSGQKQGGFKQIRFATDNNCEPSIRPIVVPRASQTNSIGGVIDYLASEHGIHRDLNAKHLIFIDHVMVDSGICGIGGGFLDPRLPQGVAQASFSQNRANPDPNRNPYNTLSGFAAFPIGLSSSNNSNFLYSCWGPSGSPGNIRASDVQLHELFHALGAVGRNSPNHSAAGHCTDANDIMCYKDGPNVQFKLGVCPQSEFINLLDCKADDYFNLNPPRNSYLSNNWNTANSGWLTNARGSNQR